ncbi:MAG: NUDIX hydrolase [Lachnospiraceae bacterium]|jgi:ADP-ribose pyrophosphatase|nr:NUDIX hydrolase [Lachnospiraceae bacterium]
MKKYTAVRKLTDNRFLNLYEMDALTNTGAPFNYYFASRNSEEKLPLLTGKLCSNGIVIYPIWKRNPEKIVMLRQYRYPLDAWLYELPAGLIDEGETASEAAAREMKEETGLTFTPYEGGNPSFRRPVYLGAGLTDETSTSVFGYADGEISGRFRESTESIEVLLVDKKEAARILKEERVSLRAAFLLMSFLRMDGAEPFAFLEE